MGQARIRAGILYEGPFFRAVADALEIDPSEIVDDYERPKLMVARVYPRMEMIRDYLNRTRLNVNALARNANVPPGIIRNILDRGGRSCSTAVALKLAKAIGVEPEEFCPALAGLEIEDDGE